MFITLFPTHAFKFEYVLLIKQAEHKTGIDFGLDPFCSAGLGECVQKLNEPNVKVASVTSVLHRVLSRTIELSGAGPSASSI